MTDFTNQSRPELTLEEKEAVHDLASKFPPHPKCYRCTGIYKVISSTIVKLACCPKCGGDVYYD